MMQLHLVCLAALVLLCCCKGYSAADAKGKFAGGNCEWYEEHISRSTRGFKIRCNNPKVTCKYTGDPHKCKYYQAKKNQVKFYDCLAQDSLKNAANACAKSTIDCSKYCGNTADFHKSQQPSFSFYKYIEFITRNRQ